MIGICAYVTEELTSDDARATKRGVSGDTQVKPFVGVSSSV